MENNIDVFISTVAFSKNTFLRKALDNCGFNTFYNKNLTRLTKVELVEELKNVDAAIIGLDIINEEILKNLNGRLKVISKYGVGLDNIDIEACKKHGIKVLHTQGVNKRSVSEMVLGNILSLLRNTYISSNNLKNNKWIKDGGMQLSNKTVGIIGLGHIGKDLVKLLSPFNCRILVNDIDPDIDFINAFNLEVVSKKELYENSEIITLHTPLDKSTFNLINKESIRLMRNKPIIINSARGNLINLQDLKNALMLGELSGAALDVYDIEPPEDIELISLPNLICTPHIGGNSKEAVISMGISAINNLKEFHDL